MTTAKTTSKRKTYENVCLGGTFDRLHPGHKILLTKACLVSTKRVVVGVTDYRESPKLGAKTLSGFMQPVQIRSELVRHFMSSIAPHLIIETTPITDPFGPSIVDKNLQAIVVSKETARGGDAVRKKRLELGLCDIDVVEIGLVGTNTTKTENTNQKLSSSGLRRDELAKFLSNPNRDGKVYGRHQASYWAPLSDLSNLPYCIAITGGIACGKSTAAKFLSTHGKVPFVDCDKLGS
jgi:phosphopantetheine adenylyltransferase